MLPIQQNYEDKFRAANNNQIITLSDAITELNDYLRLRPTQIQGVRDLNGPARIREYLQDVRLKDASYTPSVETSNLLRENFLSDLETYPAAYAEFITSGYTAILKSYGVDYFDSNFTSRFAKTILQRLDHDIKDAGSGFIYAYINNTRNSLELIGLSFTDNDENNLCNWLCARMESDIQQKKSSNAAEVLGDITNVLHRNNLSISNPRKQNLYAAIVENGLAQINRSFTSASEPDQVCNDDVTKTSMRALSLIGISHSDVSVVKIHFTGAEERARVRECVKELREKFSLPTPGL